MKNTIPIIIFFYSFICIGQNLREYDPNEIRELKTDFTEEFVKRYNSEESLKKCEEIWKKISNNSSSHNDLTTEEKESLTFCDEYGGNPWSKTLEGCNWYCGGRIDTITSSSKKHSGFISDFDFGKPWISDEKSDGKHYVKYHFNPESVRVSTIIIVNGYVKSKDLYKEYSRVKKLKMYVNGKPYVILNLQDVKDEQVFNFKPIGLKRGNNRTVTFEILEAYKGQILETAISEIYFEGDGHENE